MTSSLHIKRISDYKALILDMDGTLYYHFPVRICMAIELFFYYLFRLNRLSELFAIYKYRKNYERGQLQTPDSNIVYWMEKRPKKYIRIFRDKRLINIAERMQQQGAKIVVYSDYPLKEKLEALSPFKPDLYFSAVDPKIQCLKPDSKGLLHIKDILDFPAEDIIFIGDRFEKDGLCAQHAGMDYHILNHNCIIRNQLYRKIK